MLVRGCAQRALLYLGLGPKAAYRDGRVDDHVERRLLQVVLVLFVVLGIWMIIATRGMFSAVLLALVVSALGTRLRRISEPGVGGGIFDLPDDIVTSVIDVHTLLAEDATASSLQRWVSTISS